jgi:hypothetical protein
MVCDTVRPAPVSLAGAGAAGATAATDLTVATDLRRPGMATRFGSGDDCTAGDEDHREVDAALIAEAMSLVYAYVFCGWMDGSVLVRWFIRYSKVGHCGFASYTIEQSCVQVLS